MAEERHVLASIERIYGSAVDPATWPDTLDTLSRVTNTRGIQVLGSHARTNLQVLPSSPSLQDFNQAFAAGGWHVHNIRARRGWPLAAAGQDIILESSLITAEEADRHPYYQDLLRPHKLRWWAGVTTRCGGAIWALSMHRTPGQGSFGETDLPLLRQISPHFRRAVRLGLMFGETAARARVDQLDALGYAAALIDGRGRLVTMNEAAEALIGRGLAVKSGRLVAANPDAERRLARLIGTARGAFDELQPVEGPILVPGPGTRLMVDAIPLPPEAGGVGNIGWVLVLARDLTGRLRPVGDSLARLYGLTRRECALAEEMAEGLDPASAADRLGITLNTARTHLKAIFLKTGTTRQAELVGLVHRLQGMSRGTSVGRT